MTVNIKENGLETIIVNHLRDVNGYVEGKSELYSKDEVIVKSWLEAFLVATQPEKIARSMCFKNESEKAGFYRRLDRELDKHGVIGVIRNGFKHNGETFTLYYPLPSAQNPSAKATYAQNNFGVIRQLRYSKNEVNNAIDFVVFINGLPLATFELKNHYTGQTEEDAITQYRNDRNPQEKIFHRKRCAVHFAVDDTDVYMCTELQGKASRFMPFNRGNNGGAGNPVIAGKTMTSYLWEEIFTKASLSNIIENFAQVISEKELKTQENKEKTIWPRYHQLDAVRKLLAATAAEPIGRKFLIQHSAGSGKSNTITWLAYQLRQMQREDAQARFDSVIVVTDRVNLDRQIRDNIKSFAKMKDIVGWADNSERLQQLLKSGGHIIISTIQKFSFILEEIGNSLKNRQFAIIIDEAHSSQNGEMSQHCSSIIAGCGGEPSDETRSARADREAEPEDIEDRILRIINGRKLAKNANYYAFTATPKNKTLETFGDPSRGQIMEGGQEVLFKPFHEYTMKQAIEEGFILDVLKNYTPYKSYYEIIKKVEDDPEFDRKKSKKIIRSYVESRPETIEAKSRIIVEHFCTKVSRKIGGRARAMVVTASIERAIEYFHAISRLLKERGGQYKAIVAFTDKEIGGNLVTDASLNGFAASMIEKKIEEAPYRILIVADKFQTGYDQPLLHTMYVDKVLSGLKAVQTLSRLNRAYPLKTDTFVLDFVNDPEIIRAAFQCYYKTTQLKGESDINKLNDLIEIVERNPFYTDEDCRNVVDWMLSDDDRKRSEIDSILDSDVERFKNELNEDEQIRAKSAIKTYCRSYAFFAQIIPYASTDWERHHLFYSLLVKKLPKLKADDYTAGLLETIDIDRFYIQKEEERDIALENENTTIEPIPVGSGGGGQREVELDPLSQIVEDFNRQFGDIEWQDKEGVIKQIQELPQHVVQSAKFVNAVRDDDEQIAQIHFNDVIQEIVTRMGEDKLEFMQHYFDISNSKFHDFVNNIVYSTCIKDIRKNKGAPNVGWGVPAEEETDGGYLMAAEEDNQDNPYNTTIMSDNGQ